MDADDKQHLKVGDTVVINRYLISEDVSFPPFSPLLLLSFSPSEVEVRSEEKPEYVFKLPTYLPLKKKEEMEKEIKLQAKLQKIHNVLFGIIIGTCFVVFMCNCHIVLRKDMIEFLEPFSDYFIHFGVLSTLILVVLSVINWFILYTPYEIKEFERLYGETGTGKKKEKKKREKRKGKRNEESKSYRCKRLF